MSRTDKTNPFWVKLMHGDLAVEELHDHSDGVCDLPPIEDAVAYTYGSTRCRRCFTYTGINTCCCKLCRECGWDVRPSKRQRLNGKKLCREWDREW